LEGSCDVQIDFDKPRELKFDLRSIRDLERAMDGQPIGAILGLLSQAGVTAIVAALWAGFKHEDASLSTNLVLKYLESYIQNKKSLRTLATALSTEILATGLFKSDVDELEEQEGNGQKPAAV
jgi:hypothetical protein